MEAAPCERRDLLGLFEIEFYLLVALFERFVVQTGELRIQRIDLRLDRLGRSRRRCVAYDSASAARTGTRSVFLLFLALFARGQNRFALDRGARRLALWLRRQFAGARNGVDNPSARRRCGALQLPLTQRNDERRRVKDRMVSARADTDQQRKGEVLQRAPPSANSATSVMTTVASVLTERVIVCKIDVLTIVRTAGRP